MNEKYNEFLRIAKKFQDNGIKLLLFGSLGLAQRIETNYDIDDIDILLPEIYINEKWDITKNLADKLGYQLKDLHEHKFTNGDIEIAFASLESLTPFANININDIETITDDKTSYLLLNLSQYSAVYTASSKDSYRRNKNNNKDFNKIELIKNAIRQKL